MLDEEEEKVREEPIQELGFEIMEEGAKKINEEVTKEGRAAMLDMPGSGSLRDTVVEEWKPEVKPETQPHQEEEDDQDEEENKEEPRTCFSAEAIKPPKKKKEQVIHADSTRPPPSSHKKSGWRPPARDTLPEKSGNLMIVKMRGSRAKFGNRRNWQYYMESQLGINGMEWKIRKDDPKSWERGILEIEVEPEEIKPRRRQGGIGYEEKAEDPFVGSAGQKSKPGPFVWNQRDKAVSWVA
jgi:hypothetical protein